MAGHASVLNPPAKTAEEAIARSGLGWTVSKRPLWFTSSPKKGSKPCKVADRFAVVRDDTEQMLGSVRAGYTPVQNEQAFAWADGLGEFTFAGEMVKGGQVYIGVQLPRSLNLAGDAATMNMVLWNGHDGAKSVGGLAVPIRMKCTNQLAHMRSVAISKWFSRHTSGVFAKAKNSVAELLKLVDAHGNALEENANKMAKVKLSVARSTEMLEHVLPGRKRLVEGITENLALSETISDAQRGTAWGLLQATTEYFEWVRDAQTRESAFQSTLDGVGARTARALESLVLA